MLLLNIFLLKMINGLWVKVFEHEWPEWFSVLIKCLQVMTYICHCQIAKSSIKVLPLTIWTTLNYQIIDALVFQSITVVNQICTLQR